MPLSTTLFHVSLSLKKKKNLSYNYYSHYESLTAETPAQSTITPVNNVQSISLFQSTIESYAYYEIWDSNIESYPTMILCQNFVDGHGGLNTCNLSTFEVEAGGSKRGSRSAPAM